MIKGRLLRVKRAGAAGSVRLAGWLVDSDDPVAPVVFEILGNGARLGSFTADRARDPHDGEAIGFSFNVRAVTQSLPPGETEFALAVGGKRLTEMRPLLATLDTEGNLVERNPHTILAEQTSSSRRIRGRIEAVENGVLVGWLWEVDSDTPVRFALLVNETIVGEFCADRSRRDLAADGIGDGNHGFRVRIQRNWLAKENVFTIRTLPDEQRLADALVLEEHDAESIRAESRAPHASLSIVRIDDPHTDVGDRREHSAGDLIAILKSWKTEEIASFFGALESEVMLVRGKELFRNKQWTELSEFLPTALQSRKTRVEINTLVGRALLYDTNNRDAADVLSGAARVAPNNHSTQFYAAVANARAGKLESAVSFGRAAIRLADAKRQYLFEHGVHCRRLAAASTDGDVNLRRSLLEESVDAFQRSIALDEGHGSRALLQIARGQMELDRFDEATRTLGQLLQEKPDDVDALMLLSQSLVALNQVKEALSIAERVVDLDPLRQGPRFQLRALRALVHDSDVRAPTFGVASWDAENRNIAVGRIATQEQDWTLEPIGIVEFDGNPAMGVSSFEADWLVLADRGSAATAFGYDRLREAQIGAAGWAGRLIITDRDDEITFWRRDLLVNLAESGLIASMETLREDLAQVYDLVSTCHVGRPTRPRIDLPEQMRSAEPGAVIAMSRHGIVKFGGGEHFIESMAHHYEAMGHKPIIVGTRPERAGEEGVDNGRDYAFVDIAPAALRKFILRKRPRFVHVLSGLGYQVAEALEYLDIPFVYGVHFWRDCLGKAENDTRYFAAHDREPIPKPAFRYIVEQAAAIYANSDYTREVLEEGFSFRAPVIYSLPPEEPDQTPGTDEEIDAIVGGERDYVLLVNAKSDKGFDLMVEVAKRVPVANFLVIASQSDRREAERTISVSGVSNIRVIDHTNRMDIVYSRARAVAVPSYRFVETFSRVCIEAQRFGKPVLGAGIGNVPYLLRRSGVVLPEDADVWAEAVGRLYEDEDHYQALCAAARVNSEDFAYARQPEAVEGMISTLPTRILIAVGSGIGNMLHVMPMIANVSRRLGCKVDLVMSEDHNDGLFLLHNDAYVNSVFALRQEVLRRRYDIVFVTHSFGSARLPFQARHVIYSRDWSNFEPGGPHHEAVYNLEAAKHLLGIPYEAEDVACYSIGNLARVPDPHRRLIGMHGGSKDGFWRSKRWPGHSELAARLQARGYEVASVGIPEEYVPGTIDMTGGSIAEMADRIATMHYFISNDSGVMNIAHALGVPVIGLFGPTNPLTRGPIGKHGRWIAIDHEHGPCETTKAGREAFYSGRCTCIDKLDVDLVEARVLDHLREAGVGPAT